MKFNDPLYPKSTLLTLCSENMNSKLSIVANQVCTIVALCYCYSEFNSIDPQFLFTKRLPDAPKSQVQLVAPPLSQISNNLIRSLHADKTDRD